MNGDSSRCPHPEVLSAFVAGALSGEELKMTANHLLECEDCRFIVAETARVAREEREISTTAQPLVDRRTTPWWLAAAAAAIAAIAFLTWRVSAPARADAIQLLIDAAPREGRYLERRLTGFAWAPLRSPLRSTDRDLDAGQMKLVGAAGSVIEQTQDDPTEGAKHASAIAHLVAGRPADAEARLTAIAKSSRNARVWSDLAAARYQQALQTGDASHLAEALAAADESLRIDSRFPEALFNRALIIERLGLRESARAAWQSYLAVDSQSDWAREAQARLQKLGPVVSFRDELPRLYTGPTVDSTAARDLARQFPEESRRWGESEILSRWGHAYLAHDEAAAESHLRIAQAFGAELSTTTGERLLLGVVAAIVQGDQTAREELAHAHTEFRNAEKTYQAGNTVEAERMFTTAGGRFARAGSPAALLASALATNTIYDQNRLAEARVRLEELLDRAPDDFIAHRAGLHWQLGLTYSALGRWGDTMESFQQSIALFEQLQERNSAAHVRELLAQSYERIGDEQTAWQHRATAMRELGQAVNKRLKLALDAAARGAAASRKWQVSLSLLGLQLDLVRGAGDEFSLFQTLLLRARIAREMKDAAMAGQELTSATATLNRINDPAMRARAEADRFAVAGILSASAQEAVPLLTRAIDFHQTRGRRMFLPDLFLHRGRSWSALGDSRAALADFENGIKEVEGQRETIDKRDDRWRMFDAADELFHEAITLSIRNGDSAGAFRYAERARARTMLEALGEVPDSLVTVPSTDAVIVEYASLPEKLMIFVANTTGVRVVEEHVSNSDLALDVDQITRTAAANDQTRFRRHASRLHSRLIAPVLHEIASARTLVIVPDSTLDPVPFAALVDVTGRYVVEQHAVIVAPSAAVFARLRAQSRGKDREPRLLVVAGPSARDGDLAPLTATGEESAAVAAAYAVADHLEMDGGNPSVFAARAADADVVHFAGHAEGAGTGEAALLTARRGDDDRLDTREIARMHLKQTRTVVLAACNTARGRQHAGEGTISIARAFIAAGVPSVVATLWPIEDRSAAAFFPRLHHHLARGIPPADALRATQLEWIRHYKAPPGMWAAVQIIGS